MIYVEKYGVGGQQSTDSTDLTDSTDATESTPALGVSVSVDYWVLDESGRLADATCVDRVPGADRTDSPYSIAVETPVCGTCSELRAALTSELRTALTAAGDQGCRLLAVGVRPDSVDGGHGDGPPPETASTRVRFTTDPKTATSVYNVLLALDPAFALLESTCSPGVSRRAALMDDSKPSVQGYRASHPAAGNDLTASQPLAGAGDHWQPVELVDASTVEWRSLSAATPTLLVDLIGDVLTVLQQATDCRIEIGTFGNGFEVGCLQLPSTAWRQQYLDDAITEGLESLRLRAYLDRLGFDTGWYHHARPPAVDAPTDRDHQARCRQRAELLAADA